MPASSRLLAAIFGILRDAGVRTCLAYVWLVATSSSKPPPRLLTPCLAGGLTSHMEHRPAAPPPPVRLLPLCLVERAAVYLEHRAGVGVVVGGGGLRKVQAGCHINMSSCQRRWASAHTGGLC